jgi:hypothetical protein
MPSIEDFPVATHVYKTMQVRTPDGAMDVEVFGLVERVVNEQSVAVWWTPNIGPHIVERIAFLRLEGNNEMPFMKIQLTADNEVVTYGEVIVG